MDDYSHWIGRTETLQDDISLATAKAAAATLEDAPDRFSQGSELPLLWHWFYFLPKATQGNLGNDGHPQRETNGFMPPIPLPRRMFAGARLTWHHHLTIGRPARREAVIRKVTRKQGSSGELAFVTVQSRILQRPSDTTRPVSSAPEFRLCLEEEQDIVYRVAGSPVAEPRSVELPDLPNGTWSKIIQPDSRLLFRFSALTFNAHRIHYDRTYAINEEGYPGLVVHGPLTALLLLRLAQEHTARAVGSFQFRGQAPLFDLAPFRLIGHAAGATVDLEAQGPDAKTAMHATAILQNGDLRGG